MKFEIAVERVYPHPPERVWRALTDPWALGEWLMETDFVPQAGRDFTMWCSNEAGGTDTYPCCLLEFEPPERMLWSWILKQREAEGATFVEFRLTRVEGGTRLVVTHRGDRDPDTIARFKGGWPVKLESLEALLASAAP